MSGAISATDDSVVITVEYNDAAVDDVGVGLAWAILHDNRVLGWQAGPPAMPIILGTMVTEAPGTDPVLSPPWAQYTEGTVFVPDMWRGSVAEFFTLIATNNDAQRKVYAKFYTPQLAMLWGQWAMGNPLALTEPPNVAPEEDAQADAQKVEERRVLAARRVLQAETDRVSRTPVSEPDRLARIEAERVALARRPESDTERVEFRRSGHAEAEPQPAREA